MKFLVNPKTLAMDNSILVQVAALRPSQNIIWVNVDINLRRHMTSWSHTELIYLSLDEMAAFSQMILSDAFFLMKSSVFWWNFTEVCF